MKKLLLLVALLLPWPALAQVGGGITGDNTTLAQLGGCATSGCTMTSTLTDSAGDTLSTTGLTLFSTSTIAFSGGSTLINDAANTVALKNGVNAQTLTLYNSTTGPAKVSLTANGDGILAVLNAAGTAFSRLQLGGTTSSFPAIKRNAAVLNFRLADDSADAAITASTGTFSTSVAVNGGNNLLIGTNGIYSTNGNLYLGASNTNAAVAVQNPTGAIFGFTGSSTFLYGWTATTSGAAPDTAFSRDSADVVDVGDGAQGDKSGTIKAATLGLSGNTAIVLAAGEAGMSKITASGSSPGAGTAKFEWVAGTNAGSCKMISYAGTSTTPVTIVDNVGSGC